MILFCLCPRSVLTLVPSLWLLLQLLQFLLSSCARLSMWSEPLAHRILLLAALRNIRGIFELLGLGLLGPLGAGYLPRWMLLLLR